MTGEDPFKSRFAESVCLQRGHCGPFVNQGIYDAFSDARWHGMGECVHCHSTVKVARHRTETARS